MTNFGELLDRIRDYPGVTDDSREVEADFVFVAGGGRECQQKYLREALERGAKVIVGEPAVGQAPSAATYEYITVPNRLDATCSLAERYYAYPSRELRLIGVTGTCGKTTSTYLLESILQAANSKVGVIGTQNIRYADIVRPSKNTTPSSFVLQRTLREMIAAGCDSAVMEVSSHAIAQNRVGGLRFDGAIFTNLSTEHLDLHGSMDAYFAAKERLFTDYAQLAISAGKKFHAAVNLDDPRGSQLYEAIRSRSGSMYDVAGFSFLGDVRGSAIGKLLRVDRNGISGSIQGIDIESTLLGEFNAENILGAALLAQRLGVPSNAISAGVRAMECVPGRMERIRSSSGFAIIVDYAHKPGALRTVLRTIRPLTSGRIICVFGCGGERDAAKRPEMGEIAATLSDYVIITSDNNRREDPASIFADIQCGVSRTGRSDAHFISDRKAAIRTAIGKALPGDTVLIAGRGSEPYLIEMDPNCNLISVPFDDREMAKEALRSGGTLTGHLAQLPTAEG